MVWLGLGASNLRGHGSRPLRLRVLRPSGPGSVAGTASLVPQPSGPGPLVAYIAGTPLRGGESATQWQQPNREYLVPVCQVAIG